MASITVPPVATKRNVEIAAPDKPPLEKAADAGYSRQFDALSVPEIFKGY